MKTAAIHTMPDSVSRLTILCRRPAPIKATEPTLSVLWAANLAGSQFSLLTSLFSVEKSYNWERVGHRGNGAPGAKASNVSNSFAGELGSNA